MKNENTIIESFGLEKTYQLGKTSVHALRDVDCKIASGEFICVTGPSGAGKSTFLNLLGMLDKPSSGKLVIQGSDISTLKPKRYNEHRVKNISFVFQSFNLIPVLSAAENIEYPLHRMKISRAERKEKVNQIAEAVGITNWLHHRPDELSGGQQQRVAIARALVVQPSIVIADEPTANLDSKTGKLIIDLMKKMNTELKTTFIVASHSKAVLTVSDRYLYIIDGRLKELYAKRKP